MMIFLAILDNLSLFFCNVAIQIVNSRNTTKIIKTSAAKSIYKILNLSNQVEAQPRPSKHALPMVARNNGQCGCVQTPSTRYSKDEGIGDNQYCAEGVTNGPQLAPGPNDFHSPVDQVPAVINSGGTLNK